MIKCTTKCNTPGGTSNIVDLISSVNTLIDQLSDPADDAVANRSAVDINRQLHQLERLFARSSKRPKSLKQKKRGEHCGQRKAAGADGAAAGGSGACSRSPCSNCTTSNCNAVLSKSAAAPSSQSGGKNRRLRRRHHSASVTSSSESSYSRCCLLNPGCYPSRQQQQNQQGVSVVVSQLGHKAVGGTAAASSATAMDLSYDNSSNRRRQYVTRRRKTSQELQQQQEQQQQQPWQQQWQYQRQPYRRGQQANTRAQRTQHDGGWRADPGNQAPPVTMKERMDFGYLKSGLVSGENHEKGHSCAANVLAMERMVHSMQENVDELKRRCEQQQEQQQQQGRCPPSDRLKSEIQQAQSRIHLLQNILLRRQQAGGAGCSVADSVGCRHRGTATEQARDPLTDIKCKYERCLLYNRFDVNWPFLHIIAPRLASWDDPTCCEED